METELIFIIVLLLIIAWADRRNSNKMIDYWIKRNRELKNMIPAHRATELYIQHIKDHPNIDYAQLEKDWEEFTNDIFGRVKEQNDAEHSS